MADLVIPAGAVIRRAGDPTLTKLGQVAIAAGMVVYEDLTSAGKFNLADNDAEASAKIKGIAVSTTAIGEDCTIALPGSVITVASAIFTVGVVYYVSGTPGGLAPLADVTSGKYVTLAIVALTTTTALILGEITGVAIA